MVTIENNSITEKFKVEAVRAFYNSQTLELVDEHFSNKQINVPFDFSDYTCRLHKSKRSATINLEILLNYGTNKSYWKCIGYFKKNTQTQELIGTLMHEYAHTLNTLQANDSSLNANLTYLDDIVINSVIALHTMFFYRSVLIHKADLKIFTNNIHLDVYQGLDSHSFNIWLDDRYQKNLSIGVVRTDIGRIDAITGITDSIFNWCHAHELLNIFKNAGTNIYESEYELKNNRYA